MVQEIDESYQSFVGKHSFSFILCFFGYPSTGSSVQEWVVLVQRHQRVVVSRRVEGPSSQVHWSEEEPLPVSPQELTLTKDFVIRVRRSCLLVDVFTGRSPHFSRRDLFHSFHIFFKRRVPRLTRFGSKQPFRKERVNEPMKVGLVKGGRVLYRCEFKSR